MTAPPAASEFTPRFRQVHLDFHTPGDITDVGGSFDGESFASTFENAHVDTVNVFAKCHHGFAYYPSEVGTPHPGLTRDLLGEQIAALHARGIRAPVYISVLWDDLGGIQHPEWMITQKDGTVLMRPPLGNGTTRWTTLDIASGYRDYLFALVEEISHKYEVDGFWFDIIWPEPNYSPWARERARSLGVDISDDVAMRELASKDLDKFHEDMTSVVRRNVPEASIFFNGSMDAGANRWSPHMTHLEIESLPTSGEWGYMHYPVASRFARTLGLPTIGMTGRFHKSWADFGGLKPVTQLDYECGTIMSGGSAISIGDQLDPSGKLDPAVYKTIGAAYQKVRELEPWLHGARPAAEAAIIIDRRLAAFGVHDSVFFSEEVEGAAQMLLDLHVQFDIVDPGLSDLSEYSLIIVPDELDGSFSLREALERARSSGSKIILSGRGGIDPDTGSHSPLTTPAVISGETEVKPSYITPGRRSQRFSELDDDYGYVFYDKAYTLRQTGDGNSYGALNAARYERRWDHFYSHQQAPIGASLGSPWCVISDDVAMLAVPIFGAYRRHDYWAYKALLASILDQFLPVPLLSTNAPASVEASLHTQPTADGQERSIVHLTAFTPRRGYSRVPRIDEGGQLAGIRLEIASDNEPTAVYLAPSEQGLEFTWNQGLVRVELPPIGTQTIVVLE